MSNYTGWTNPNLTGYAGAGTPVLPETVTPVPPPVQTLAFNYTYDQERQDVWQSICNLAIQQHKTASAMDWIAGLFDCLVNAPTPGPASFASVPSAALAPLAPCSTSKFKELWTFNSKLNQVCYWYQASVPLPPH
jgi:hypothetical protein